MRLLLCILPDGNRTQRQERIEMGGSLSSILRRYVFTGYIVIDECATIRRLSAVSCSVVRTAP